MKYNGSDPSKHASNSEINIICYDFSYVVTGNSYECCQNKRYGSDYGKKFCSILCYGKIAEQACTKP